MSDQSSCRLQVRIRPGARHNSVLPGAEGGIVVSVTSAPVDGKANEHLIKLLSKTLRLSKSSFEIVMGHTCRDKVIEVFGMSAEEITAKITPLEKA